MKCGKSKVESAKSQPIPIGWAPQTKFRVPIPFNEPERLATLRSCQILDTPSEEVFNDIIELAAGICGAPIAMISLVDSERQWFKAKLGISATETPRDIAFCAHAIMERDLFVIPDATADRRFATNPLVTTDPKIRFYAGAPLVTAEDHAVGTLCVIDRVPRQLSREQQKVLRLLARQVVELLELRRQVVALKSEVHSLQSPASRA
jgi:two-component system, OmpR family, sensor histidine kinase VicK